MSIEHHVKISASVMCIDWLNVAAQLDELKINQVDYLHWDIIDGRFAADFTMGSSIINKLRQYSDLPSDYHLMVDEPSGIFEILNITPGDIVTIHQECCRNLHRDLVTLRRMGAKVGVALCPGTPLQSLDYVIEDVDHILIMTVNPGYMGQKLVPQTLRKISELRKLINDLELDITISVDGNVNYENVPNMVAAGADILVGGSSGLFRHDISLSESIKYLRTVINEGVEMKNA